MSTNILQIDSSIFGDNGQSSQLANQLVTQLTAAGDANILKRNVSTDTIPHFGADTIAAIGAGKAELADTLIAEAQAADVIVISAPMYNFTIPSGLKSWLDHLARAGTTFKYTDQGPVGLLVGKKVYVITTRGGKHADSEHDHIVPYLRTILGFIGLAEDMTIVYAEGLSMSEFKESSMAAAQNQITQLIGNNQVVDA